MELPIDPIQRVEDDRPTGSTVHVTGIDCEDDISNSLDNVTTTAISLWERERESNTSVLAAGQLSHLNNIDAVIGRENIVYDWSVVIDVQHIHSYSGISTAWLLSLVTSLHNQYITRNRRDNVSVRQAPP